MVGDVLKRVINLLVVSLAGLAFFLLPVGRKTPAQHLVSIFKTAPAREAAAAFAQAARQIAARVRSEVEAPPAPPTKSR